MKLLLLLLVAATGLGASAQEPLPFFHANDVVLFQGDSITDGGRWREGSDFNHIMGQDYAYILAAEVGAEYPERNLTFVNRGISGERVLDLASRWQRDVLDLKPNVLSILVGINDTLKTGAQSESVEVYEATYDRLIGDTLAKLPGVKIILGEPFLLPVGKRKADYAALRVEVAKRAAVVRKLATKYHLPLVAYQQIFDDALKRAPAEHWSWDGVHPTYAGHGLMEKEWLKAAQAFWGKG